jgi:signal transduction histidine kinase/ActR/RegA family two-component response regulator
MDGTLAENTRSTTTHLCGSGITPSGLAIGGPGNDAGVAASWSSQFDYFTNFGAYVPRVHCLQNAQGEPDWPWIIALIVLTLGVIAGYLRIVGFWFTSHYSIRKEDRNQKLMDLAQIFIWCAVCGYAFSIISFFWPGYRLLAACLVVLNIFTWKFISSINAFSVSVNAKALEHKLEATLQNQNEELHRLVKERTAELETARAAADQASRSKSEFLANMSHEIRTPMAAIVGYADLLADESYPASERAAAIETVRKNADHLLGIINDILDLSKVEAGRLDVERVSCDPVVVISEAVNLLAARARGKNISLSARFSEPLPIRVNTDPARLRQILINLIGNAVKFTELGGITLSARMTRGGDGRELLSISVSDTGVGMTTEQIERLFRPFTQADTSITLRFGGTGLGLTICKRFAQALGGDISVTSVSKRGSVFTVTIDPGDRSGTQRVVPGSSNIVKRVTAQTRRAVPGAESADVRGRVLLAEDGPDNQRLITHHLRRFGLDVMVVDNGRAAVEAVHDHGTFDIILMDMSMPLMDGYTATGLLRSEGYSGPIVALTAHAMSGDRERCIRAGCTDYLTKPVDPGTLRKTCVRYTEQSLSDLDT